jgi:tetratricopeptide (TPR) repeat protein
MAVEKQATTGIFRPMSLDRTLLAAQGYIELDMPVDALAELDALGPEDCEFEPVLQMRLFILMKTRAWDDALALCRRLRELYPDGVAGYIHGAFCLHENGRTAEARDLLLSAPAILEDEATYFYNLACYSAVLGDINAARDYAQTSFAMDEKFREIARLDPDLHSLRKEL